MLIKRTKCEQSKVTSLRDPFFLFLCHLEWRDSRSLQAYEELIAALDDPDEEIRAVAEHLLHRASPRRQPPADQRSTDLRISDAHRWWE